jgi:hypothetical protein
VIAGMARQGFDVELTRYDERGWRATFYTTGMEHSITSDTASAFEATPWRAVQRAAWESVGARRYMSDLGEDPRDEWQRILRAYSPMRADP